MTYLRTWYISVGFIFVAGVLHVWCTVALKATSARLGGAIRDGGDLAAVRSAINLSMALAIVYLALYVVMIALLIYLIAARGMSIRTAALHLLIFGLVTFPISLLTKSAEKAIRTLRVESPDRAIADSFKRWLVQWRQARLKLPD